MRDYNKLDKNKNCFNCKKSGFCYLKKSIDKPIMECARILNVDGENFDFGVSDIFLMLGNVCMIFEKYD